MYHIFREHYETEKHTVLEIKESIMQTFFHYPLLQAGRIICEYVVLAVICPFSVGDHL